jgi:glyoxylase-like metal-dependent hydrolase (beta-lactamase superfamily II)
MMGGMLRRADIDEESWQRYIDAGYRPADVLISALPAPDFEMDTYEVQPCPPTRVLEEGDVVDLGDRAFEVLHLPGHSPDSIGLWDATTGVLFSGDAVYDGPLLDSGDPADIAVYVATMERLRALPVEVVHGGHDPSFGRARLVELCDAYIARAREPA